MGRVEALARLYEGTPYRPFEPDAFESPGPEQIVAAQKTFLEGTDFDLTYFPLQHLGYKCVVAAVGELYAGLSAPRTLSVTFGVSAKWDFVQVRTLWSGVVTAAQEHGFRSVAFSLLPSVNGLVISLAATGALPLSRAQDRSAAHSKDLICLGGRLGAAYIGMQVLERGRRQFETDGTQPDLEPYRMMVGAYLKPEMPVGLPERLSESGIRPSYGYLVDKGLADTLLRLHRDSGLGVKVYAERIPFEGNTFAFGKELDIDPVTAAMNGGEDYRLLWVIPLKDYETFRRDFQVFDIIGHLALPEAGAVLVTPEGAELPLKAQGWPEAE